MNTKPAAPALFNSDRQPIAQFYQTDRHLLPGGLVNISAFRIQPLLGINHVTVTWLHEVRFEGTPLGIYGCRACKLGAVALGMPEIVCDHDIWTATLNCDAERVDALQRLGTSVGHCVVCMKTVSEPNTATWSTDPLWQAADPYNGPFCGKNCRTRLEQLLRPFASMRPQRQRKYIFA